MGYFDIPNSETRLANRARVYDLGLSIFRQVSCIFPMYLVYAGERDGPDPWASSLGQRVAQGGAE